MALPFIALAGIGTFLSGLVSEVVAWYLKTRFAQLAATLTIATVLIAAFATFTAGIYAAIAAINIIAPDPFKFAVSFIPPSGPIYGSIYLTALISKRTFDWVNHIYRQATQTVAPVFSRGRL
jgi:hypothetical protein